MQHSSDDTRPTPALPTRTAPTSRHAAGVDPAPLLAHNPHGAPPLHYNLAHAPGDARLPAASKPLSAAHRALHATIAPVDSMRVRADALPWTIHITEAAPGHGVRVGDVLDGLYSALWRPLRDDEFAALDVRTREKLQAAFRARVARAGRAAQAGGIMRLDWLQGRAMFCGLVPALEPNTWTLFFS